MIYLYVRVSHKASKLSGLSIDDQIDQCRQYAQYNIPQQNLSSEFFDGPPGVFADRGVSGWKYPFLARPAGMALESIVQRGDHIVVYSIDRFARNIRDFANMFYHWESKGVHVHYVVDQINTSTAAGKLQANIRASMAQFFSDLISERTREALLIKKLTGSVGAVPKVDKVWESSEFRQAKKNTSGRTYGTTYRYERVSSDSQYTSGLGLQVQSEANEAYARRHCELTGSKMGEAFVEEAISAFSVPFRKRPQAKRLMEILKPGDDVVMYRSDRGFRSVADCMSVITELVDKGVHVHIVSDGLRTDTRNGLDWIGIMAAMAQLESGIKSRRVKEVHARLQEQGRPSGVIRKGLREIQINGKSKLGIHKKDSVFLAKCWILINEFDDINKRQKNEAIASWKAIRDGDTRGRITYYDHSEVDSRRRQSNYLKETLPDTLWAKFIAQAREEMAIPIGKEFWIWDWKHDKLPVSN